MILLPSILDILGHRDLLRPNTALTRAALPTPDVKGSDARPHTAERRE